MDKTFPEAISGIRSAVMASEVREDIAQGMEYVERFASTATTKAAEAAASAKTAADAAGNASTAVSTAIDPTLSLSGKAADAAKVGEVVNAESERAKGVENQIKEELIVKKNETFSWKDIDWINGYYGEDGTIISHALYKHTRAFKVEPETKVTYAHLRSPANFSPYIACFKNGVYIKESSLLGDIDAGFKSGEFTIPKDIDGISFVSYDVQNEERLSISGIFLYYKPDVNVKDIESIKTNIQHMESDIAGNYNQIYNNRWNWYQRKILR